jgi:phage terminase small subunit
VKTIPTKDGKGVEREVRMHDKLKALELLGKRYGLFTDNVNLSGEGVVQIVDDIPKASKTD